MVRTGMLQVVELEIMRDGSRTTASVQVRALELPGRALPPSPAEPRMPLILLVARRLSFGPQLVAEPRLVPFHDGVDAAPSYVPVHALPHPRTSSRAPPSSRRALEPLR